MGAHLFHITVAVVSDEPLDCVVAQISNALGRARLDKALEELGGNVELVYSAIDAVLSR